jgi:hypothetical protein
LAEFAPVLTGLPIPSPHTPPIQSVLEQPLRTGEGSEAKSAPHKSIVMPSAEQSVLVLCSSALLLSLVIVIVAVLFARVRRLFIGHHHAVQVRDLCNVLVSWLSQFVFIQMNPRSVVARHPVNAAAAIGEISLVCCTANTLHGSKRVSSRTSRQGHPFIIYPQYDHCGALNGSAVDCTLKLFEIVKRNGELTKGTRQATRSAMRSRPPGPTTSLSESFLPSVKLRRRSKSISL